MPESDPGSLTKLHDIVVPPPVSWWPPAPGWYFAALLVTAACCLGVAAYVKTRRRNQYRREALAELACITSAPGALTKIAVLLKRTALAAFPRERIAPLTGRPWLEFLDATSNKHASSAGGPFTSGPGRLLADAPYQPVAPIPPSELAGVIEMARHWILHHQC